MRLFTSHLIAIFLVIGLLTGLWDAHYFYALVCAAALLAGMWVMSCVVWRDIFHG